MKRRYRKRMGRIVLSILLLLALLIQLLPQIDAYAATAPIGDVSNIYAELTSSAIRVTQGDSVDITMAVGGIDQILNINGNGMCSMACTISYDWSAFTAAAEPVDITTENKIPAATCNPDFGKSYSRGQVYYSNYTSTASKYWTTTTGGTDNKLDVFKWTFTTSTSSAVGTYKFYLTTTAPPSGETDGRTILNPVAGEYMPPSSPEYIEVNVVAPTSVSYNKNGATGGTVPASIILKEGATTSAIANPFTRTLHVFTGWNTAADGTGTSYSVGDTVTMGTSNIVLYAQWTKDPIGDVSNISAGLTSSAITVFPGESVDITMSVGGTDQILNINGSGICSMACTIGYDWSAFTRADEPVDITTENKIPAATCNPDFGSKYSRGQVYYSNYTSSASKYWTTTTGGTDNKLDVFSWNFTASSTAAAGTYRFYLTTTAPPTGEADGRTILNPVNGEYMPSSSPEYIEVTVLTPTHTLSYNGNGATSGTTPASVTLEEAATTSAITSPFTRTGYAFAGWNTTADGTGTLYSEGDTVTMSTSAITLYAQWTANAITFSAATLTAGTANTAYTGAVAATGGSGSFSYALTSGSLPTGISLSTAGTISGTPTAAGTSSFTITATDTVTALTQAAAFSLTINTAGTVATPTASPAAGAVEKGTTVTLSCGTSGATIYYTTDGTTPTTGSSVYSSAIAMNTATTIKAIGVRTGYTSSGTLTAAYTITTHTVTYNANGGSGAPTDSNTYTNGSSVTVLFTTTPTLDGYIFAGWAPTSSATTATYTSGGTKTFTMGTSNVTLYAVWKTSTITFNATTLTAGTANTAYTGAVAATGGSGSFSYALTSGSLPTGLSLSTAGTISGTPTATGTSSFTITATDTVTALTKAAVFSLTINTAGTVATPTASPAAGAVENGTTVTLSCGTSGATIYYTTDGTTPTTGSAVYSSAIPITIATTIKAIGVRTGYNTSGILTAAYTITTQTITTYTVTYNANGGSGVPTDSNTYTSGSSVTVLFTTTPTLDGYFFAGWAPISSATTATYTSGGTTTFNMGTSDVTLYAVWTDSTPELGFSSGSKFWITTFSDANYKAAGDTSAAVTYTAIRFGEYVNIKANDFKAQIIVTAGSIKIFDGSNTDITDSTSAYIGSTCTVALYDAENNLVKTYLVILKGDINGDGFILTPDVVFLRMVASNSATVSLAQKYAGDINRDGYVLMPDVVLLRMFTVNTGTIDQTLN